MAAAEGYRREYRFGEREFARLRALVAEHTGIHLTAAKRDMTYGRIVRRLRALGLASFDEYCELLERDGGAELEQFVNAITTNLTSFFREGHHFEFLAESALPELLERNRAARRLRLWSAGCSTGEEPYSIAITLLESCPAIRGWDARILATDLDSNVLERARRGVYPAERIATLSPARAARWFTRLDGGAEVRVTPQLQELIRFRRLNLLEPWPMRGPFDVIFCRNVVIYFDKPTQRRLFDRFAEILAPAGYLLVGHSETLFRVSERFELIGKSVYRRVR